MIHAERSNESLVEAFKNMHVHEEMVPDDNEDTVHEVILSSMIDSSQKKRWLSDVSCSYLPCEIS